MVTRMTDKQESDVLAAVGEAITLANDGMAPSQAIAKVASQRGLNSNFARRMVEAFNVSKTLKHHKEASGDQRAATFDIADAEEVIQHMFPKQIATPAEVKASEWIPTGTVLREERFYDIEKAAEVPEPMAAPVNSWEGEDRELFMKRAYRAVEVAEHEVELARSQWEAATEASYQSMLKLGSYFRSMTHEPFERVEGIALEVFGDDVKPVMDVAWDQAHMAALGEKRASGPMRLQPVELEPYERLQGIMDAHAECQKLHQDYEKKAVYASEAKQLVDGFEDRMAKAGAGSLLTGMLADSALAQVMGGKGGDSYASLVAAIEELGDPDLENERKSIRTRVLLKDLMSHDEVLRQAEPQKVISAFNEIAQLAPTAVETPMALRSLLRKHVEQGQVAPEDVSTVMDIEKGTRSLEGVQLPDIAKEVILGGKSDDSAGLDFDRLGRIETAIGS